MGPPQPRPRAGGLLGRTLLHQQAGRIRPLPRPHGPLPAHDLREARGARHAAGPDLPRDDRVGLQPQGVLATPMPPGSGSSSPRPAGATASTSTAPWTSGTTPRRPPTPRSPTSRSCTASSAPGTSPRPPTTRGEPRRADHAPGHRLGDGHGGLLLPDLGPAAARDARLRARSWSRRRASPRSPRSTASKTWRSRRPLAYDVVVVDPAAPLAAIAQRGGHRRVEDIRQLNPQLRSCRTRNDMRSPCGSRAASGDRFAAGWSSAKTRFASAATAERAPAKVAALPGEARRQPHAHRPTARREHPRHQAGQWPARRPHPGRIHPPHSRPGLSGGAGPPARRRRGSNALCSRAFAPGGGRRCPLPSRVALPAWPVAATSSP